MDAGVCRLPQVQRPTVTERTFAEGFNPVTDTVGEGEVEAVVRHLVEFERASHLETKPAAEEHEGNVV